MKKSLSLIVLGALVFGQSIAAHADTSFNISTVSLYKSRGVDQDGRNQAVRPALQGGVDYSSSSGFYLGNWNSTGRFGHADVEIDLYGGYRLQLNKDLGLDLGYIEYVYPHDNTWTDGEVYAGLNYQRFSFKAYRGVRPNVNDGDMYYLLGYTQPLMEGLDLKLGLGYQTYQVEAFSNKIDYSVGLEYAFAKHLVVSGTVAGANHRSEVDDGSRDARFILGIGATF
ncbi:MAG TPA: TorF family putative porin [Castellaniella sp.]|uniref:TorF family putative porin n=1 Tax=Castellaniella sp. TaxID=1955812 RepID=UPI002EEA1FC2